MWVLYKNKILFKKLLFYRFTELLIYYISTKSGLIKSIIYLRLLIYQGLIY